MWNSVHRRSVVVYVCCTSSGVIRSTLFMVLYMFRMFQCRLHGVLRLQIFILMILLVAEPRRTAGLLIPSSRYLCETKHLADPVFDGVGLSRFKNSVISTSGYMRRSNSSSLLRSFYLKLGRRMKYINKSYSTP